MEKQKTNENENEIKKINKNVIEIKKVCRKKQKINLKNVEK